MQIPMPIHRDRHGREIKNYDDPADNLPQQVVLPFYGKTVDVDGLTDARRPSVRYIGKATLVFDNLYKCLAIVSGTLCVVEVTITPHDRSIFPSGLHQPVG